MKSYRKLWKFLLIGFLIEVVFLTIAVLVKKTILPRSFVVFLSTPLLSNIGLMIENSSWDIKLIGFTVCLIFLGAWGLLSLLPPLSVKRGFHLIWLIPVKLVIEGFIAFLAFFPLGIFSWIGSH